MPMDLIPAYFPIQFDTQWKFLVQQKDSRLRAAVTSDTVDGDRKKYNQIGLIEMAKKTDRAAKTKITDIPLQDRWLYTQAYDIATIYDEFDKPWLGNIAAPDNPTMMAFTNAYNRACDDVIINAATGTALSGQLGTTQNPFPATQKVAQNYVASGTAVNSGLTLAKLIKMKSIFGKAEVDESEERFLIVSQAQLDDLLNNVDQVSNERYNQIKALYDGQIQHFMGFTFIRSERLSITNSVRTIIAFVKRGIMFGDGDRKSYVDILPEQSHAVQIRTTAKMGALRLEDKLVVACDCLES